MLALVLAVLSTQATAADPCLYSRTSCQQTYDSYVLQLDKAIDGFAIDKQPTPQLTGGLGVLSFNGVAVGDVGVRQLGAYDYEEHWTYHHASMRVDDEVSILWLGGDLDDFLARPHNDDQPYMLMDCRYVRLPKASTTATLNTDAPWRASQLFELWMTPLGKPSKLAGMLYREWLWDPDTAAFEPDNRYDHWVFYNNYRPPELPGDAIHLSAIAGAPTTADFYAGLDPASVRGATVVSYTLQAWRDRAPALD